MSEQSWIQIDMPRLDANLDLIRKITGNKCEICAVVKADAYGLGALTIARRLVDRGVNMLAVYNVAQATELAKAGIHVPILIFMPIENLERQDILYRTAVAGLLHLTVHSRHQLKQVESIGMRFGIKIPVHFEIDTGMSRTGMKIETACELLSDLPNHRYVRLAGIFTHASSAEYNYPETERQYLQFSEFLKHNEKMLPKDVLLHFAASHAMLRDQRYHFNMVRVGVSVFGYGQSGIPVDQCLPETDQFQPVVQWWSRVVHLQDVEAGAYVGYGGTWQADRATRLAILPAGFADGYPLSLSNKAVVRVGERLKEAPVRGAVNMDQLIIDVTDIPEIELGTPVELISNDPEAPNSLLKLASLANSNIYEMLCRLSHRVSRKYVMTHQKVDGPTALNTPTIHIESLKGIQPT